MLLAMILLLVISEVCCERSGCFLFSLKAYWEDATDALLPLSAGCPPITWIQEMKHTLQLYLQ